MSERLSALCIVGAVVALFGACPTTTPPETDAGVDAGADAGTGADAGFPDAGCVTEGYDCDVEVPCCDPLNYVCDPIQFICVLDGGASSGGSTGGSSSGLPNDGAQWLQETVSAEVVALSELAIPSLTVHVAVGSGPGLGQLVVRSPDAGWSVLPGVPLAAALNDVWADPAGDIFAVGQADGGTPLLIAGSLAGGLSAVNLGGLVLDGGPFVSLEAVIGLAPGEALAAGAAPFQAVASVLHLLPDGGLALETLPGSLTSVYKLTGGADGGPIFGLATSDNATLVWVVERAEGVWSEEEVFSAGTVSDLTVGPAGDVIVAGNDGVGDGQLFTFFDGGYFPVVGGPAAPPFTAICEPQAGEIYAAAAAPNQALVMLHTDGGVTGSWWSETLPADAQSVAAIAGDGASNFFAVGTQTCSTCAGFPMVLRREP